MIFKIGYADLNLIEFQSRNWLKKNFIVSNSFYQTKSNSLTLHFLRPHFLAFFYTFLKAILISKYSAALFSDVLIRYLWLEIVFHFQASIQKIFSSSVSHIQFFYLCALSWLRLKRWSFFKYFVVFAPTRAIEKIFIVLPMSKTISNTIFIFKINKIHHIDFEHFLIWRYPVSF